MKEKLHVIEGQIHLDDLSSIKNNSDIVNPCAAIESHGSKISELSIDDNNLSEWQESEVERVRDKLRCSEPEAREELGYPPCPGEFNRSTEPFTSHSLSVNLSQRAFYLLNALDEYSQYSKNTSFTARAKIDAGYNEEKFSPVYLKKYGLDYLNNVERSIEKHRSKSIDAFMDAYGHDDSSTISSDDNPNIANEYSNFINKFYGDTKKDYQRSKFRKAQKNKLKKK